MKACVIGHPITQSKSPIIHNYWMNMNNIEGTYQAIDITPENLKDGIEKLISENYKGFNITAPHKQNIMQFCNEMDDVARLIGAVNTVRIEGGKLYGTNTDAFGFIQNIKENSDFDFTDKKILVLGAGGAARAILYGLIQAGVSEIILTNRTMQTATDLAKNFNANITVAPWEKRAELLSDIDLLVNTTSLGMQGKPPLDMDLSRLNPTALVNDIVYAPLMTPLLTQAKSRGNKTVTGIGMLLHQARPAFAAWTGITPEVTAELESLVLA